MILRTATQLAGLENVPGLIVTPLTSTVGVPPMTVLLAEDNRINQKVLVRMLNKMGHAVMVVDTGKAAVAQLLHSDFDLVLMDVQMPEMDGFEATAAIRGHECTSGKHTRIVAVTAHAMAGDRERCLAAGMDDYLTKPVDLIDLRQVLARSQPAGPSDERIAIYQQAAVLSG